MSIGVLKNSTEKDQSNFNLRASNMIKMKVSTCTRKNKTKIRHGFISKT